MDEAKQWLSIWLNGDIEFAAQGDRVTCVQCLFRLVPTADSNSPYRLADDARL